MLRKTFLIFREFARQMSRQNVSAFSASTAFFIFLSLIPMLIVVCTIIPFTPVTEANLMLAITELTPDTFDPLISNIISQVYDKSASILSVAVVATIWSAGKGVLALIRGLNAVNDVVEDRNYFVLRLVASFYTVILLMVTVLSLIIMVFGNVIVGVIVHKIPQMKVVFDLLMNLRFLVVWLVLTFLFALIYVYIPNKKQRFSYQLPGAAFSAIAWSGFSWGFSIYVDVFDSANAYGSLSIIILIMLWLYFCIYIIMIGAHLNRYFYPVFQVFLRRRKNKISKQKV